MISLAIALSIFSIVLGIFNFYVPGYIWLGVILGLASMMGFNFAVTKIITKKIKAIFDRYQKMVQAGNMNQAIALLEEGYKYSIWQFGVKSQIGGQIGITHYLKKDFAAALPFLEKAFVKNWVAKGMLGIIYMKKNDMEKMEKVFNKATKSNPKEGLLWSLYAYCLSKKGKNDLAIKVLSKANEKLPDDPKIKTNLFALKNRKKMKLKMYGMEAMQFQVDRTLPSMNQNPQTAMFHARRAKVSKKRR